MARPVKKAPLSEKPIADQKQDENIVEDLNSFEDFEGFDSTDDEAVDVEGEESAEPSSARESAEKEKIGKLASAATKNVVSDGSEKRGVVYIGRIPHGLYEPQLRTYLEQFGTITRLRISRNKTTGASKHFGFVEFASRAVAEIVCETMNNYLLFGHLLKVNMMDASQIHPELWVGANHKYHAVPWNTVNKQRAERKHSREWWQEKQQEFEKSKKVKARELAELGIIY